MRLRCSLSVISTAGCGRQSFQPKNGTVFSYVMNNYDGDDETPFQGGDFSFPLQHYFQSKI